jgi:hypothetical protein
MYLHLSLTTQPLLPYFTEQFGSCQPDQFAAGWNQATKFEQRDSGFFQGADVVLGTERGGDEVVEVGSMSYNEDGRQVFVSSQLAKELKRLGAGQ